MKKSVLIITIIAILLLVIAIFFIVLSNNDKDTRTMAEFIKPFQEKGYEIDLSEKPLYSLIGANDGIIFYIDGSPIKIYKYDSEKLYKEAKNNFSMLESLPKNGLFVLDTNNNIAEEIFNNITK